MPVNTAKVQGRRTLRFSCIDDILTDADRMAALPVRCLGNWSAGQIFKHLAIVIDGSVDGLTFDVPWFVRQFCWLFKQRFLYKPMSAGFRLPEKMAPLLGPPANVSLPDGLTALHQAVARYKAADRLAPSPALGQLTREEYDNFHERHAEMHLSFLVPQR